MNARLKRLGINSIWMSLSRLGAQGLGVGFTVLLGRGLGSAGFGEYAFLAAVLTTGNALTTFGTDMHLIRQIAREGKLSGLGEALAIQLGLSLLFIAGVGLAAPGLPNLGAEGALALRIYALALLPLAFFSVFTTALRAVQEMAAYMLLNLALAAMQVAAAGLIWATRASIVNAAILLAGVQGAAALLAGALCILRLPGFWGAWRIAPAKILPLARACLPIALLALFGMLYQKLAIYLLTTLDGASMTGWFAAALRTVEASKTFHLAVFTALYPAMAQAGSGAEVGRESFLGTWKALLAGAALLGLGLFALAEPLVGLLFGAQFQPAVPALRILAWILLPFTVNTFQTLAYLAGHREGTVLRVQLAGLAALAGLGLWWIPLAGLSGAALACLAAESLQALIFLALRAADLSRMRRGAAPALAAWNGRSK